MKIAVVTSRFNEEITQKLLEGARRRLVECHIPESNCLFITVPGAVEIPLAVQRIAHLAKYDAIIALGAVIRGETTHYDYVCQQVSQGCQRVMLENDVPVIFGVLTTENEEQALDRLGGKHGHKGADAVNAAIETVRALKEIR